MSMMSRYETKEEAKRMMKRNRYSVVARSVYMPRIRAAVRLGEWRETHLVTGQIVRGELE